MSRHRMTHSDVAHAKRLAVRLEMEMSTASRKLVVFERQKPGPPSRSLAYGCHGERFEIAEMVFVLACNPRNFRVGIHHVGHCCLDITHPSMTLADV